MTMTKSQLIDAVATESDVSRTVAAQVVKTIFDSMSEAIVAGNRIEMRGFGTFSVAQRKATTGRNPQTGATIQIPASKQPKFKAGKALKDAVN